ncbi:hypothetical protein MRX96_025900 [Rhipicephalus microplus]
MPEAFLFASSSPCHLLGPDYRAASLFLTGDLPPPGHLRGGPSPAFSLLIQANLLGGTGSLFRQLVRPLKLWPRPKCDYSGVYSWLPAAPVSIFMAGDLPSSGHLRGGLSPALSLLIQPNPPGGTGSLFWQLVHPLKLWPRPECGYPGVYSWLPAASVGRSCQPSPQRLSAVGCCTQLSAKPRTFQLCTSPDFKRAGCLPFCILAPLFLGCIPPSWQCDLPNGDGGKTAN